MPGLGASAPVLGKVPDRRRRVDAGAAVASRCHPGDTTFQRASYVVLAKQRTMHAVVRRSGVGLCTPFARYWLSGFLADFGDGVRLAAFPLLAVHLTRSPAAVAAVTAVQGVPWLLLGG